MKKKTKLDKRIGNGGKRPGAGRKPLLSKEEIDKVKEIIGQHGVEVDDLKKKERILVLLDKLYEAGMKGNIFAIKEYLDRQLGKSKDSIDITSKGKRVFKVGYGTGDRD